MLLGHGGNVAEVCSKYGLKKLLDFSTNVNPLGYPLGLKEFIFKGFDDIKKYPDVENIAIRRKISSKINKLPENIILGNGSTELMYTLSRALSPKRGVIYTPSYADYNDSFLQAGLKTLSIPLLEDDAFIPDLDKLYTELRDGDIFILGNPNNPTSNTVSRQALLGLVKAFPKTFFVIDESFNGFLADWGEKTLLNAPLPDNLIILQSLTKLYAIPGLRLGMLAASEATVRLIRGFMEPWSVNSLAIMAADFISEKEEYREKTRAFILKEKDFLFEELSKIGWLKPFYPESNFILIKIKNSKLTAPELQDSLLKKHGIYIRTCTNFTGLNECFFRIAVLGRDENKALISALRHALRWV